MFTPSVVLELIAFWPLVIGIFALILRRRLVGVLEWASRHSFDGARSRAVKRSVLYGALLLIDIGLGATVWSYASGSRPAVFFSSLVVGLVLLVVTGTNVVTVFGGRNPVRDGAPKAASAASVAGSDSVTVGRPPYSGIVETAIAKVFVVDADPRADARRTVVRRLTVVATLIFAVAALIIVGIMLVAVVGITQQ
ncbi:hypothetical protein ACFQ9V_09560 [Leifsonia sp. NPDC056665]|uniref:hypothetical protein n=1 Tax=Leifsonia sp. NPDC056665 TaxID=3345901 RepID=UPI0036C05109